MKLVFVNDGVYAYAAGDPSAVGGAERQQWMLARALAARGWFVTVGVRNLMNAEERRTIDDVDFVAGDGADHRPVGAIPDDPDLAADLITGAVRPHHGAQGQALTRLHRQAAHRHDARSRATGIDAFGIPATAVATRLLDDVDAVLGPTQIAQLEIEIERRRIVGNGQLEVDRHGRAGRVRRRQVQRQRASGCGVADEMTINRQLQP